MDFPSGICLVWQSLSPLNLWSELPGAPQLVPTSLHLREALHLPHFYGHVFSSPELSLCYLQVPNFGETGVNLKYPILEKAAPKQQRHSSIGLPTRQIFTPEYTPHLPIAHPLQNRSTDAAESSTQLHPKPKAPGKHGARYPLPPGLQEAHRPQPQPVSSGSSRRNNALAAPSAAVAVVVTAVREHTYIHTRRISLSRTSRTKTSTPPDNKVPM